MKTQKTQILYLFITLQLLFNSIASFRCIGLPEDLYNQQLQVYQSMKFLGSGSFGDVRGNSKYIYKRCNRRFDLEDLNKELKIHDLLQGEVEFTNLAQAFCYYPKNQDKYEVLIVAYRYKMDLFHFMHTEFFEDSDKFNIIDMITQLALSLKKLHDYGFGHFDLKTENILLLNLDTPVIHDFGTVLHADEMPQFKHPVGTPGYIAPEILSHTQYSYQGDLFSFGVLLAELANKKTIYFDLDQQILEKLKNTKLHIFKHKNKHLIFRSTPGLDQYYDIIYKLIDKDLTKRGTIDDVIVALQPIFKDIVNEIAKQNQQTAEQFLEHRQKQQLQDIIDEYDDPENMGNQVVHDMKDKIVTRLNRKFEYYNSIIQGNPQLGELCSVHHLVTKENFENMIHLKLEDFQKLSFENKQSQLINQDENSNSAAQQAIKNKGDQNGDPQISDNIDKYILKDFSGNIIAEMNEQEYQEYKKGKVVINKMII